MKRLGPPLAIIAIGIATIAWVGLDGPHLWLVLKHGTGGGPTGRKRTEHGLDFVELSAGYYRMGSHVLCEDGGRLGSFCSLMGLAFDPPDHDGPECPPHWVEIRKPMWIAVTRPPGLAGWEEAIRYCENLTRRGPGVYWLPSEAEWEYAARLGVIRINGGEWCRDRWFGNYRDGPYDERPRTRTSTFLRVVRGDPDESVTWRTGKVLGHYGIRIVAEFPEE